MSVPKENIWQDLRKDCLDAIPPGSRASRANRIRLADWQRRGYYVVRATTAKHFELTAATDSIGTALLTDAECLLDSATEHQVSLWRHIHSPEWLSPAWLGVTFYYWAFYLALAITRLTGRTAWFLTKDVTNDFKRLGPPSPKAPGAGCFRLICGAPVSATERTVLLENASGRIHEEIWRLWFGRCASKVKQLATGSSNSLEERLFTALADSGKRLGTDWPNTFRNAINYRTGFAYAAVRREQVLKSLGYLKQPGTYEVKDIVERFENGLVRVRTPDSVMLAPQAVAELLVDLTFLLHALTTELYRELVDRHKLDERWQAGRRRFLQDHRLSTQDGDWPL